MTSRCTTLAPACPGSAFLVRSLPTERPAPQLLSSSGLPRAPLHDREVEEVLGTGKARTCTREENGRKKARKKEGREGLREKMNHFGTIIIFVIN